MDNSQGKGPAKQSRRSSTLILLVLLGGLVAVVWPVIERVIDAAMQTKVVGRAKSIVTGCAIFAADKGGGRYPNGRFDVETGQFTSNVSADSAEGCFQDLFDTGIVEMEVLFQIPQNSIQCGSQKPNEDRILQGSENGWDYISGLNNKVGTLPMIFEASDSGGGKEWTRKGGHPWKRAVVIGFSDGASARKESLDRKGRVWAHRGGGEVDACLPTPGKNGWPPEAVIAPATPSDE